MELETIILDDDIEYAIIKELKIADTLYTLFVNINDPNVICYRKTIVKDDEEYYAGLDDDKEFDLVSNMFANNILEENG